MARVNDNGMLVGLVGTVVYYEMNGKNYVRKSPREMKKKRSAEVRKANSLFGTVSKYGSDMFGEMKPYLSFPFSRETHNNLRSWIYTEYKKGIDLQAWPLNSANTFLCTLNKPDLRDFMKFDVQAKNEGTAISVLFPSFNPVERMKPPLHTIGINIKVIVATHTFNNDWVRVLPTLTSYEFNYSNQQLPEKQISLQTNGNAGDIAMVILAIEYKTRESVNNFSGTISGPAAGIAIGKLD